MYKRIIPINVGTFNAIDKSIFSYRKNQGKKIKAACIMWYIEGSKENIIVDTGPSDPFWSEQYHHQLIRTEQQRPDIALKKYGISPNDVKLVINTHLHWDHCYGNDLFKNAKILVQEQELIYALNPLPCHEIDYETNLGRPFLKGIERMEILSGDVKVADGILVIHIPGHTPGMQGVLIETKKGKYLIASDAVGLFENWQGEKSIPSGIFVNLEDYYISLKKITSVADFILPGHDIRVFENKYYP